MTKESPATESVTLYFKSNGSDKVYRASLEQKGSLWMANFAFGRRGTTLTTGTKTQEPVAYVAAKKAYDKMVKDKTAKGYTAGESGTPYQFTDLESRDSGLHPQLLCPIDEAELERLIRDDNYCMQEKFDGKRILLRRTGDKVEGINRLGLTVGIPVPVAEQALTYGDQSDFVIDGEMISDVFYVFDCLHWGVDWKSKPYQERLTVLRSIAGSGLRENIKVVDSWSHAGGKRRGYEILKEKGREGVVFKRLDSPYVAGRPASGGPQLKYKFVETASCIVAQINVKRSIALELYDGSELISVGNCTIPPNWDVPKVGEIVEIAYLYSFPIPGGSLYQPVYKGPRSDIPAEDCVVGQLKFKPE